MEPAPPSAGITQDRSAKTVRPTAWRSWLLEPLFWITFLLGSLLVAFGGAAYLLHMRVAVAWVAGFVYTVLMPYFVLSPGRGQRSYNPSGQVVGRTWRRLVAIHLICVSVFMSGVALHQSTAASMEWLHAFDARHADLAAFLLICGPLTLVIVQGVWSSTILDATRRKLAQKQD